MYQYDLSTGEWLVRRQNAMQRFGRRNHSAWSLNKFMIVYGGMNDFNQTLGDLAIYDLEKDKWVENLKVKNASIPPLSHACACSVFYE